MRIEKELLKLKLFDQDIDASNPKLSFFKDRL